MICDPEGRQILRDLAACYGYVLCHPDELTAMVAMAAAERPERVHAVDEAIELLEKVSIRAKEIPEPRLASATEKVVGDLLSDLRREARSRGDSSPVGPTG